LVGGMGSATSTPSSSIPYDFVPYSFILHSAINYPYTIPSVIQIHPALSDNPNIINVSKLQGVYTSNLFGTPINPAAIINMEHTLKVLLGAKSK